MAKRYQPSQLIGEQGGVQTFAGRDVINGLPVRVYSFVGEPTLKEGELRSDFIPPVLSSSFTGLAGEVVSAFSDEFKGVKGAVAPGQVEALLRETAAALDDAAKVGVVHGDLSPERVFFDREGGAGGRFILEGYGVPWPVRPSEFSAPERISGASFAGDIFSWARTVKHLSGPLPGELRDLLDRCLNADPKERPHAREVRAALGRYPFSGSNPRPNPQAHPQAHRDTSAFESYAENYTEDDSRDYGTDYTGDADSEQNSLGEAGLTLPPKTFKLKEYRRQTATRPSAQPSQKFKEQSTESAAKQPSPDSDSVGSLEGSSPVSPKTTPSVYTPPNVQAVPSTPKLQRTKDSLSQTDATAAYKVRLAAYQAKQNSQEAQTRDASTPTSAPASETVLPPRVRVQRAPAIDEAVWDEEGSSGDPNELDFGDAFEVDDDINDRAPDPTLYRGGRRVFLLTLLGIAVLVLLALQLINA